MTLGAPPSLAGGMGWSMMSGGRRSGRGAHGSPGFLSGSSLASRSSRGIRGSAGTPPIHPLFTPQGISVLLTSICQFTRRNTALLAKRILHYTTKTKKNQGYAKTPVLGVLFFNMCSRQESNLDLQLRRLVSYPLNDGGVFQNYQQRTHDVFYNLNNLLILSLTGSSSCSKSSCKN